MGKEIKKYNPEWLEAGCFGANWFTNQQKYLRESIETCPRAYLKLFVDSEEQMEAWAPILFKHNFTYTGGVLTIKLK